MKLTRKQGFIIAALLLGSVMFVAWAGLRNGKQTGEAVDVERGPIKIWSSYEGYLESRFVRNIFSRLGGSVAIVEIAPEGLAVAEGDLLVRFDSTALENDLVQRERDYTLAKAELEGLRDARLPLELRDLELRLLQSKSDLAAEEQFLKDSHQLLEEGLVAEAEVAQQAKKVDSLRLQSENMEQQLSLTREYLHPSQIEKAEAGARAAERALLNLQQAIADCSILAPAPGVVVYKPLNVGGEFRTVRVGDSIFKNQSFMALPDMTNLIVHIDVPEAELGLVGEGQKVTISPKAFPDLKLDGSVESVASIAQNRMDRPSWQKFFHATIKLNESNPRLRSGMSVLCKVLNEEKADAVLIPRRAVRWEKEEPVCKVVRGSRVESRILKLGKADEQRHIVLEGVEPGDRVLVE